MAKPIISVNGQLTEVATIQTSAGAADAGKIPNVNASGVLDPTIVNAKATSAGAGDAGKVVQLDASGKLDQTLFPAGLGADALAITTSEALSAGNFVNVWNDAGTAKVRKADATVAGKEANGFVLSAYGSGVAATVYFEGTNTAVTGQTAGPVFLGTTAGGASAAAPTATGQVVQRIGFATSATSINFQMGTTITLA